MDIGQHLTRRMASSTCTTLSAEHTRKPILSQFDLLVEQGIITMDHLIKRNSKGKTVEKGPLFKIKPQCVGLLFPPSKTYDLLGK